VVGLLEEIEQFPVVIKAGMVLCPWREVGDGVTWIVVAGGRCYRAGAIDDRIGRGKKHKTLSSE